MSEYIDYENLTNTAFRGLIKTILTGVSETGLPGAHHFFITFDTRHEGIELADWLRQRYPEEMTIIMQHWFENLVVGDDGFSISLNFGEVAESLYIPFLAIKTFVDPSVEFGLSLDDQQDEDEAEYLVDEAPIEMDAEESKPDQEADVVSLDNFRK